MLSRNEDATFALHLKSLVALAFVPTVDVVDSFEELDRSDFFQTNRDVLDGYMDYFLNTWIGGFDRRGARKRPLYPIELWNCRDSVLQDLPKTNNFAEGFHRGFLSLLSAHHPSITKFVKGLLLQQVLTNFRTNQFRNSNFEVPAANVLKQVARLKAAVMRYGTVPTLDFLRGVAHCI